MQQRNTDNKQKARMHIINNPVEMNCATCIYQVRYPGVLEHDWGRELGFFRNFSCISLTSECLSITPISNDMLTYGGGDNVHFWHKAAYDQGQLRARSGHW